MSIFKRREEDLTEGEEEKDEISSKKFRDLKPENRKKRKEPVKPWGKKERALILFVFGTTILMSAVLAASGRSWKLPGLPRLKIPSLNIFREETIVIGMNKGSVAEQKKADQATAAFKDLTKNLSGVYGFYVIRFKDGTEYGLNEQENFEAASVMKLPIILTLYKEADAGRIKLDAKYTLKADDKLDGPGSLSDKPVGTELSLRELAGLVAKESDNTATKIIRKKILGDDLIQKTIDGWGLTRTSVTENISSPYDTGRLLYKLWKGEIISKPLRDEFSNLTRDTNYEDWLPKGIPNGVTISHKVGFDFTSHVINDAGIIFAKEPYALVVMNAGVVEEEAVAVFPKISEMIYETEQEN